MRPFVTPTPLLLPRNNFQNHVFVSGNRTSELVGFNYENDEKYRMSYLETISNMGLLRESGCPLNLEEYKNKFFFLFFKTTFEVDRYSATAESRITQESINPSSPAVLYLRFSSPLRKVLRCTIFFRVSRQLQISSDRETFLSHSLEQ